MDCLGSELIPGFTGIDTKVTLLSVLFSNFQTLFIGKIAMKTQNINQKGFVLRFAETERIFLFQPVLENLCGKKVLIYFKC